MYEEKAIWRQYPEIPFIEANQFGEIRTVDRYVKSKGGSKRLVKGHVLKQCATRGGYLRVYVRVNGKFTSLSVHRIIASCFLPNPDNLPEVNHKDNNRKNNTVSNLEWCTREYNIAYREKYGTALNRPVFAVNLKTGEVSRFESQREAARQLGVNQGNVNDVLKGRLKQTGGYWFTEDKSKITEEKIQEIKDGMNFFGGVFAVNLKTFEVSRFESQSEAARQLGLNQSHINNTLKGRYKQTGGYWFCYADEHAVEKIKVKFGSGVAEEAEKLQN